MRTVLDLGCGEGLWAATLRRERPRIHYLGIDPSAYVVQRFGARRNIHLGNLGSLDTIDAGGPFDLILCNDVLHYVAAPALHAGMRALTERLRGVAYLGLFTSADDIEGDLDGFFRRPPSFYRDAFKAAGLRTVGMHCWIPKQLANDRAALELNGA